MRGMEFVAAEQRPEHRVGYGVALAGMASAGRRARELSLPGAFRTRPPPPVRFRNHGGGTAHGRRYRLSLIQVSSRSPRRIEGGGGKGECFNAKLPPGKYSVESVADRHGHGACPSSSSPGVCPVVYVCPISAVHRNPCWMLHHQPYTLVSKDASPTACCIVYLLFPVFIHPLILGSLGDGYLFIYEIRCLSSDGVISTTC
jgi:hypothetical protein